MEKHIYVMPKEGLLIRNEYTGVHIPPEGGWVKRTTLISKLLRAEDLREAEPPKEEAETVARKRERMVTPGTTGSEG